MSEYDSKLICPILFLRFIDDGFGIMEGNRNDVLYIVMVINSLVKTITIDKVEIGGHVVLMDLVIFKNNRFWSQVIFDTRLYQKEDCIYNYIPVNSDHQPLIPKKICHWRTEKICQVLFTRKTFSQHAPCFF
jgi:hypothetical protein